MDLFSLDGKVAIITGSSRGIGKAIAEAFAAAGARVVISSRKQDACDEVANAVNAEYDDERAIAIAASISDKPALERLVAETRERLGKIDILVCNAASNPYYGSMSGISDEQFRKVFDNNVLANNWLAWMVAPDMIERGDGAIIVVSSVGGMIASKSLGTYNMSKAADFQLVRNLALELGEHNIRVNAIAPGLIKTHMSRALWENQNGIAAIKEVTPLGRIGQPEEIAGAAVFLASKASGYVTGQSIIVDGGAVVRGLL